MTIVVLLLTVALIAREVFSPDFLLLEALLVLAIGGVLTPTQVLAGFSNPAIATIAGLFFVAAGIRATGLIDRVTQAMFGEGATLRSVLARTTTLSAIGSASMSNTAIVASGIPTLDRWTRNHGISPSKLLIPLSYASIIGGVSTLIGTSTNLVIDGLLRQNGIPGLGFFELSVVGVPVLAAGIVYLTFVAPRILPPEKPTADTHEFVTDVKVNDGSDLVGKTAEDAGLNAMQELYLVRIQHRASVVPPVEPGETLAPGDRLTSPAGASQTGHCGWTARGLVAAAASGLLALPIASPVAGLLMIVTGCVSPDEARRSVNWSVLVAVGSAIGIASALDVSGAAAVLGRGIAMLAGVVGTWGLLLGVFFGTVLLTELIINQAAAALMFPVVIALASTQGLDPRPLVLTATVAASTSFSTPLNYQTNLMVYGPGKYRFTDFTKVGVPLQLLLSLVAISIIQYVWPLAG